MKQALISVLFAVLIVVPGFFFLNHFFHFVDVRELLLTTQSSEVITDSAARQTNSTGSSEEPQVDPNQQVLDEMSLEEKVGQLFLARVPETNQLEDIQTYHLGGYLLFGRDVENETAEGLKNKIAGYQAASKLPLLIASDEEGGTVTRISQNTNLVPQRFQSPQQLFAAGGVAAISEDTKTKAAILQSYGINLGLFPDADVATDPAAFIYDRTIGQDANGTAAYVENVVKTLQGTGVGSTLKHFPGYGNNRDSHVEVVTDTRSMEELTKNDLIPFEAGIKAGAESILVSHNIIQAIDGSKPASISQPVHELLRDKLGFKGVIMTDDMDMAGLADFIPQDQAGLAALQAGNDLILSSSYSQQIPFIIEAIKKGEYSEAELDRSVLRVLAWKRDLIPDFPMGK